MVYQACQSVGQMQSVDSFKSRQPLRATPISVSLVLGAKMAYLGMGCGWDSGSSPQMP